MLHETDMQLKELGNYTVLTSSMNYATNKQAFAKRTMDIAGGIVGCIFTGIIFIFIAPVIYISSAGTYLFLTDKSRSERTTLQNL